MRELVDHDVVGPSRCLGAFGWVHVGPAQHHRATLHRLAGKHLVVAMHDALLIDDLALGHDRVGVDHDADEAVVLFDAEFEHRQAGLQRHRQRGGIVDDEAAGATELLAVEEQARHAAQAHQILGRAPGDERQAHQRLLPKIVGDRAARERTPFAALPQRIDEAPDHSLRSIRAKPSRVSRNTWARAGAPSQSQSLSTWRV